MHTVRLVAPESMKIIQKEKEKKQEHVHNALHSTHAHPNEEQRAMMHNTKMKQEQASKHVKDMPLATVPWAALRSVQVFAAVR